MLNKKSKDWEAMNLPKSLVLSQALIDRCERIKAPKAMPEFKYYDGHGPITRALVFGYPHIKIDEAGPEYTRFLAEDELYHLEHSQEVSDWSYNYEEHAKERPDLVKPIKLRIDYREEKITQDWREIRALWQFREYELEAEIFCNSNHPSWITHIYQGVDNWNVLYIKIHFTGHTPQYNRTDRHKTIPLPTVTKKQQENWENEYPKIKEQFLSDIESGKYFTRISRPIEINIW